MRLAVISDIHSNLEALTKALDAIEQAGVDAIYCLGDIVGYGADPAACVELVRTRCAGAVAGNHDQALVENEGAWLPSDAQAAIQHNRDALSPDAIAYLGALPLSRTVENCTLVHATPDEPRAWKRLTAYPAAQAQFEHFDTDVCFIGHTHVPAVMANRLGVLQPRPGHRFLINVGSVGQPRDHNPRLSFALFDTETFQHQTVRLRYDVDAAAAKIKAAGLPHSLARRLFEGT